MSNFDDLRKYLEQNFPDVAKAEINVTAFSVSESDLGSGRLELETSSRTDNGGWTGFFGSYYPEDKTKAQDHHFCDSLSKLSLSNSNLEIIAKGFYCTPMCEHINIFIEKPICE